MSPTDLAVQEQQSSGSAQRVVNDFSIQIATVNGSGSQTANMVLLRSILLMGVPVSGKNMFPSNIAGLPTWYTIRASKRHYIARKKEVDFLVAMNAETAKEDVLTLEPGAAVVYDEGIDRPQPRLDVMRGNGMTTTVGRLRPCNLLDWKFVLTSHNVLRGAAGAAILNAEVLARLGKLNPARKAVLV